MDSINAPFDWDIYEEDVELCCPPGGHVKTWRDIASMSPEQLDIYYCYVQHARELHREFTQGGLTEDDLDCGEMSEEEIQELMKDESNWEDGYFLPF